MGKPNELKEVKPEEIQEEQPKEHTKDQEIEELRKQIDESNKAQNALQKQNEEMETKLKYQPEKVPLSDEQKALPVGMQDAQIKTTVRNMATIIKEKMDQLHDMATMEVLLETSVRAKNRLESIKKMTSAQHIKVRGIWKTIAPKMYISGLESKKINNDEYQISFGVYETDDKGNKKLYTQFADVMLHDGSTIHRPTSAQYNIGFEVVERIKSGKPIAREVVKLEKLTGDK